MNKVMSASSSFHDPPSARRQPGSKLLKSLLEDTCCSLYSPGGLRRAPNLAKMVKISYYRNCKLRFELLLAFGDRGMANLV